MVLQGPGRVLWGCGLCSHGSVVPGDVSRPEPHCATVRVALGDVCVCVWQWCPQDVHVCGLRCRCSCLGAVVTALSVGVVGPRFGTWG